MRSVVEGYPISYIAEEPWAKVKTIKSLFFLKKKKISFYFEKYIGLEGS